MKKKLIKKCQTGGFIPKFSKLFLKHQYKNNSPLVPMLLKALYGIDPWDFKVSLSNKCSNLLSCTRNDLKEGIAWYTDGVSKYPAIEGSKFHNDVLQASDIFSPINPQLIKDLVAKLDYIGGTPHEARIKFWNKNPELVKFINETAVRYNISPNLLLHRLSKEGFVDYHLNKYNNYSTSELQKLYKINLDDDDFLALDGFSLLGMDNVGTFLLQNLLDLKDDVNYSISNTENEKGDLVTSATGKTLKDNIILQAATLEYMLKLMKQRGYPVNQLDMYTNAAYNLGPYHKDLKNNNYIQKNYSIPMYNINTYKSGGGISRKQLIAKNATKFAKGGVAENPEQPSISWMSRQDYLNAKADKERQIAYLHSLNRTTPDVPLIPVNYSEEYFNDEKNHWILYYTKKLASNIDSNDRTRYARNLKQYLALKYNPYESGSSCAYTATGNYSQNGVNRRCSGNLTFASNPQKYGFVPITKDQLRPGDLVQTPDKGHMMTFDSYDNSENSLYNYSDGGEDPSAIKIKKKFPMDGNKDGYYYTFVGTPEDLRRWTGEWLNKYMPMDFKPKSIYKNTNLKLPNKIKKLISN